MFLGYWTCALMSVVFATLFFDVEIALLRHNADLSVSWLALGRCEGARPSALCRCNDSQLLEHEQQVANLFRNATSFSLYPSRMPPPVRPFQLALPGVYGRKLPFGADFAARGYRRAVASTVVHLALAECVARRDCLSVVLGAPATAAAAADDSAYFAALSAAHDSACLLLGVRREREAYVRQTAFVNGWHGTNRSLLHSTFTSLDDALPPTARVQLLLVPSGALGLLLRGGATLLTGSCSVTHVLLLRATLDGDVFAELRLVLQLVDRCDYRAHTFVDDERPLRALSRDAIADALQRWTPGAVWPAERSLWLHLPRSVLGGDLDEPALPPDRRASL